MMMMDDVIVMTYYNREAEDLAGDTKHHQPQPRRLLIPFWAHAAAPAFLPLLLRSLPPLLSMGNPLGGSVGWCC
jgi:hypothetical protein